MTAFHKLNSWLGPRGLSILTIATTCFFLGFRSNGILKQYTNQMTYVPVPNNALDHPINAVSDALKRDQSGKLYRRMESRIDLGNRYNSSNIQTNKDTHHDLLQGYIRDSANEMQEQVIPDIELIQHKPSGEHPKANTIAELLGHSRNFTKESELDEKITNALPRFSTIDLNTHSSPVNDFYYIKIHKTGSTTLQNIIYRYGFEHNLTFALFNCENAMPFPNAASSKYLIPSKHKRFNIVADHALFDPSAYRSYMSPDTQVISQLRHPMKYLTSSFGFQFLDKAYGLQREKDPVATFLRNPNIYDPKARWKGSSKSRECGPLKAPSFTKNAMAYHMGYIGQYVDTLTDIRKFLMKLDKQVSFVLILEKFDESLVLLKRFMKWSMNDIIYLPLWSLAFHGRKNFHKRRTAELESELVQLHKKWAPVDYAIYEFYTEKLDATLSEQDQHFWDEVSYFKSLTQKTKSFCQSMCHVAQAKRFYSLDRSAVYPHLAGNRYSFNATQWHDSFDISYIDCIKMVLATMEYHAASKARQIPELCDPPLSHVRTVGRARIDPKYCKPEERIVYTFPWPFIKSKLFRSRPECLKNVNG